MLLRKNSWKINLNILLYLLLISSCTKREIIKTTGIDINVDTIQTIPIYNYAEFKNRNNHTSSTFIEDTLQNKNTKDNIIYRPKRQFIYKYKYVNDKGETFLTQYYIKPEAIFLMGRLVPYEENLQDSTIVDRIGMYVYSGKGNTDLGKERTVVRYDFFNFHRKQRFAIQNMSVSEKVNKEISIPTFTSLTFVTNFLYPFPELDYPIKIGDEKENVIGHDPLVKSWLELYFDGSEIPNSLTLHSKVTSLEEVTTLFKTLNCYKVETVASSYWEDKRMDYYFNEKYGVVKYVFYDAFEAKDLVIELETVNDNL